MFLKASFALYCSLAIFLGTQASRESFSTNDFYRNGASLGPLPHASLDQSMRATYKPTKLLWEEKAVHTMAKEEPYHTDYSPPQNHKNSPIHP
ncbi:hypothetical protein GOP47_0006192 [Adiantum capillus-veneris]|uniref:Uncharacterized protein n=1 Tax=Adiantum capillus-veneris TaxID=13818 RepID=A0A9D4ZMA7_ADICA|nr:hypothetical protein GOP47_0006192 [Adiantum capillus-veneris]